MTVTDPLELRTFLVIGVGTAPATGGLPPASVRSVGPFSRVADLLKSAAAATSDYVAIQRATLPACWVRDAALLLEEDPALGAVVVVGTELPGGDLATFGEAGVGIVVRLRHLVEVGGLSNPGGHHLGLGVEPDLQWRLAARGYRIAALPVGPVGSYPAALPLECRLTILFDNVERATLERTLPGLVVAAVTSPLHAYGTDTAALDLQRSPGGDDVGTLPVDARALTGARTVTELSASLPELVVRRQHSQGTRRVSDRVLAPGLAGFVEATGRTAGITDEIAAAFPFGIDPAPTMRVLVVTSYEDASPGGERLAQVLGALDGEFRVHRPGEPVPPGYADWPDAVILEGAYLRAVPWVAGLTVPVLVDLSNWSVGRALEAGYPGLFRSGSTKGIHTHRLLETISRADLLVVADEDHRDGALGLMAGCGRLNDLVYDEDASLRTVVDVLDADGIARWCRRPRRAVDLVHTFIPKDPPEPSKAEVAVSRATVTVQRALRRAER